MTNKLTAAQRTRVMREATVRAIPGMTKAENLALINSVAAELFPGKRLV